MRSAAARASPPVPQGRVRRLQVAEHADEDLTRGDRGEPARVQRTAAWAHPGEQRLAAGTVEELAAVKGIEEPVPAAAHCAHDEMPRQPDARRLESGPRRHGHVQHRERDRNPEPALDHVIEEAVARIVVVLGVPPEPLLLEQESGDGRGSPVHVHTRGDPLRGAMAQRVEPLEPVLNVEPHMGLGGDPQRSLGQRTSIDPPGERHEPSPRIHDGSELSESRATAPDGSESEGRDWRGSPAGGARPGGRSPRRLP